MEPSKNTTSNQVKFTDPVICYPGHIDKCSKISKTARNILDIILIIMRIDNHIYLDEETIRLIKRFSGRYHGNEFATQTIRNVITELSKNELILKYENKNYFVNPIYFMKFSPEERRLKLIEDLFKEGVLRKSNS